MEIFFITNSIPLIDTGLVNFLFLFYPVLIHHIFQGICLLYLNYRIYWHKVVQNILFLNAIRGTSLPTGGPVGKNLRSQCRGPGLIPGWGTRSRMHAATKSPHATTKKPTCCN